MNKLVIKAQIYLFTFASLNIDNLLKTLAQSKVLFLDSIKELYGQQEAESLARIVFQYLTGYSFVDQVMHQNDVPPDDTEAKLKNIMERLLHWEPVQYIFGETDFLDLRIKVNPSVLIPRPETEELVLMAEKIIRQKGFAGKKLLDIGTGSGCIAISLKKRIPELEITAVDISETALETARKNANDNNATVDFKKFDILNFQLEEPLSERFDIIISNPPYVTELDKMLMQRNVLDFEPATALFVSDNDPLLFYRKIAEFARINPASGGVILLEINENYGEELKSLYLALGFKKADIKTDLSGRNRFAIIQ